MNETIVVDQVAPPRWESIRLGLNGSFYLSEAFAQIMAKQGAAPLFFSSLNHQGATNGMALGFLSDQWRRWPGNLIARSFHWQTHPTVEANDAALQKEFTRGIIAKMTRMGVRAIHLHSEDAVLSPDLSPSDNFRRQERLEFRIRLAAEASEVMSNISPRKRTYLRGALKKSEVSVREANDLEAVSLLIDMQHVSRERRRARGEDYQISGHKAAANIYDNYVKPGYARIFISYLGNQPLSGVLLHVDGRSAYYTMSGCTAEGFEANAPLITVWNAIEHLCADGYAMLNMGGVAAASADSQNIGHGLYRFKRSFGGEEVNCTSWQKTMPGWRAVLAERLY